MANRQDWIALIRQLATKYGVDPRAALAVASSEGLSGGVGDAGTSYGPFQLHRGGALPAGRDRVWAESPAGIEYALRQIAGVAKGLSGPAAIEAIVRKFERPADPTGEIARASQAYGSFAGGGGAPVAAPGVPAVAPVRQIPTHVLSVVNQSLAGALPGEASPVVQQPLKLPTFVPRRAPIANPQAPAASLVPEAPQTPLANHVVQFAASQLGQPYVWGGESRKEGGFDCSGLVDYALRAAGVKVPGRLTTYSALKLGRSVKGEQPQPGDMVIVNGGKHMVLYAGNGRVIAAPHKGAVVQYQPFDRFAGSIVDIRRL